MIDLHCHALPGRGDDGPVDRAGSLALLRALAQEGVEVVALTPYLAQGEPGEAAAGIRDEVAELRAGAAGAGLPSLLPGAEVDLGWALPVRDEHLKQASLGGLGHTLLIRAPAGGTTLDFDDMLLNLTLRGYRVVLAHPESSRGYQDQPRRLGRLIREGVLVQVAAASLLAEPKARARRMAAALLQEEAAHVIASNSTGLAIGPPGLAAAVEAAEEIAGPRARWMVTDAPAAILAGADLPPAPSPPAGRGRRGLRRRSRAAG